jgi:hypothetical protein
MNNFYKDSQKFKNDLIMSYETILDIIRFFGKSGIVDKKRQETYKNALMKTKEIDENIDCNEFVKELVDILTEKPKKIMKQLFTSGEIVLEDKDPYNGIIIRNGEIQTIEINAYINAFKNLSVLSGLGIGIGDSGIKEIVYMGYNDIEQLNMEYQKNKFEHFRKGLSGPLCKYFEGTVRLQKMSREEASQWNNTISGLIDKSINDLKISGIKHKIAGSYARKEKLIGDIDYIIVSENNQKLYYLMKNLLDKLVLLKHAGNLEVEFDSVVETPSKPINESRYSCSVKLWYKVGILKTKVEIYGYSKCEICFPYFARSAEVNLQKKVKYHASKQGYKLSPWNLDIKDTDIPISSELIFQKIGKNEITSIKDLFKFLEYSK